LLTKTFGNVQVDKVVEIAALAVAPDWLIGNATADGIDAERCWLGQDFIDPQGRLVIGVHSFVIRTSRRTILVDTCCGNGRHRGEESPFSSLQTGYLANLNALGLCPEDIDLVFCTHLHVDHVGWNVMQRDGHFVPTFPNARYLFSAADFAHRLERDKAQHGSFATLTAFRECVIPIVDQGLADFVGEGDCISHELDDRLVLASLPGHCPGHLGVRLSHPSGGALITGDALHHPVQLARPDWFCTSDVDPQAASQTRHTLIDRYADTDTVILTSHFAGSTAGRIISHGNAARFCFMP
jgi:glyoxylase-like metal-dependent hydrolase (beta-lactamase superfamily II)